MSNRSASSRHFEKRASLLCVCLLIAATARGDEPWDRLQSEVTRVFNERKDAVVRVEAYDQHGRLCGTGFFADPSGTVYTLASTVANADKIYIVRGDRKTPAQLLTADPRSGVAILKADCNSPFIPTGDSHKLTFASPVMTIGYPNEVEASPSFGLIQSFDRQFLGRYFMTTHLRARVPVEPGFGGAPLLNFRGEVIGMIISGIGNGASCYALPIEAAEKIRMDYARYGEPRYGWVGVIAKEEGEPIEGSRVRVSELGPDTPAGKSGMKDGDILLQVGQVPIAKAEDLIDASYFLTAGDKVDVVVIRDGQKLTLEMETARHPIHDGDTKGLRIDSKELHALVPGSPIESNLKLE